MDDFEELPSALDTDAPEGEGAGSKLPFLALLVGLVGIIFGVAGVYMGAQAQNALESYRDSQAAAPDTTGERLDALQGELAAITEQLASVEERLGAMGSQQVSAQRSIREMREQTQRAFEGVSREVSANRAQLNDTTSKLEELIENLQSGAVRRTASPAPGASGAEEATSRSSDGGSGDSSGGSSGGDSGQAEAVPAAGEHVVESGETLSRIAARYGISLSELMAANPTVDPRRMRVGQRIVIPEE